jgi:hypothetical protein
MAASKCVKSARHCADDQWWTFMLFFLFSKLSYAILSAATLSPMLSVGRATAVAGAADMMLDNISIIVLLT